MLAGLCPVEGYSEDIAKFIVIGALGTVFPCLNRIKHFRKKTTTYRKTEGIQSYLRIWGTYDPIALWVKAH